MRKWSFHARCPSKSRSGRCETKLSCEISFKKWKWKMWKRSFRARHPSKRRSFGARRPSKSESGRCENKAFVRDLPQKVEVEDVKTKLWCETSLKKWLWKICKQSSRARRPYKSDSGKCETEAFVRDLPQKVKVEDVKTKLSCETSLKSESWRCENKAFVRDMGGDVAIAVILW